MTEEQKKKLAIKRWLNSETPNFKKGVELFAKYGYSKSLKRQLETTDESEASMAMLTQALKDLL